MSSYLGLFRMATILGIRDQGETSCVAYRGQLELNVARHDNNLKINIVQLRHMYEMFEHVYVEMSLLGSTCTSKKRTSVQKTQNGCGKFFFDEYFRFVLDSTSTDTRLCVKVFSRRNCLIGSMSFGIHDWNVSRTIVADGSYFLLDEKRGLSNHMQVKEQKLLNDEENEESSAITSRWRECNDTDDTKSHQDNLNEAMICAL